MEGAGYLVSIVTVPIVTLGKTILASSGKELTGRLAQDSTSKRKITNETAREDCSPLKRLTVVSGALYATAPVAQKNADGKNALLTEGTTVFGSEMVKSRKFKIFSLQCMGV
jgi:hypothetical protein